MHRFHHKQQQNVAATKRETYPTSGGKAEWDLKGKEGCESIRKSNASNNKNDLRKNNKYDTTK